VGCFPYSKENILQKVIQSYMASYININKNINKIGTIFTDHYVRWPRELTGLQPDEDECKYKKTCATIKTRANTKRHPQIKKNIFISSTTHVCSKYSQHNQIQKRAANVHNTTKYRNALQITRSTTEMFPENQISWDLLIAREFSLCPTPFKGQTAKLFKWEFGVSMTPSVSFM